MNKQNDIGFVYGAPIITQEDDIGGSKFFWFVKRSLDIFVALLLIPIVAIVALLLLCLNPFFNKGPLFYSQLRYGRDLNEFRMWKFRTMVGAWDGDKYATDEGDRIRPLGAFLRAKHIDELPQVINVLKGDMSLIGPRPEQRRFVHEYLETIPSYKYRHTVRPGVTGLAQVEQGYTDCIDGARGKLRYDLRYIRKSSFGTEWSIIGKTFMLIAHRFLGKEMVQRRYKKSAQR